MGAQIIRNLLVIALALGLASQAAHADNYRTEEDWPERDVIKFLGKPTKIIRQKERGCNEVFYQYDAGGPYMQIEFRCDHANVAWFLFEEPKFKIQNAKALELANSASNCLTRTRPDEIMMISSGGGSLQHYSVNADLEASGRCRGNMCLLTYSAKP